MSAAYIVCRCRLSDIPASIFAVAWFPLPYRFVFWTGEHHGLTLKATIWTHVRVNIEPNLHDRSLHRCRGS